MKSFAYQIKEELLEQNFRLAELKAFVKGLILVAAKETEDFYQIRLHHSQLLNKLYHLVKKNFEVTLVNSSLYFQKNLVLEKLIVKHKIKQQRFFYGGVFFGRGSISKKTSHLYHLEVSSYDQKNFLFWSAELISGKQPFVFNTIFYKHKYIAYLKNIEAIIIFLAAIGAYKSHLELQNIQIENDLRATIKKQANLDFVNSKKIVKASWKHLKHINFLFDNHLERNFTKAQLRFFEIKKAKPYLSLLSCAELLESEGIIISKSGLNHWLRKAAQIFEKAQNI